MFLMSDILAVDKVIMHYATYVVVHSVPSTYRDQGIFKPLYNALCDIYSIPHFKLELQK